MVKVLSSQEEEEEQQQQQQEEEEPRRALLEPRLAKRDVALRVLRVVVVVLLLLMKTKPLRLGSFIYRIRISLNTKHLYTSSH